MHLICPNCGSPVEITATFSHCPTCEVDLASRIAPEDVSRAVYRRAVEQVLAGHERAALEDIRDGLAVLEASELRLLAALLHRKRGEYQEMRRHVAAIPVDDILRPEGEWLLRSHQEKLKAARQARRRSRDAARQVGKANRQFSSEYYPFPPAQEPEAPKPRSPMLWTLPLAAALLAVLFFWARPPIDVYLSFLSGLAQGGPQPASPTPGVAAPDFAGVSPPTSTALPLPTATAGPITTPPMEMAGAEPGPVTLEPVAAGAPAGIAAAIATAQALTVDLKGYLRSVERPDLAALAVEATRRDGELILRGTVPFTQQRLELLELAQRMEGVTQVNGVDLRVRLPETYTVEEGDTLWTIAYKLYGDGSRWEDVYAANSDLLGNLTLLTPGMILKVPSEPRQP